MRIDFGTAQFLGFIGVMIPVVFVLAGFVIAGIAIRFKVRVPAGDGSWDKEQELRSKSTKLMKHYLVFGWLLLAIFLGFSALKLSGATCLVSALHAVFALATLIYFSILLKRTSDFYFSVTRMTVTKHLAASVKVG